LKQLSLCGPNENVTVQKVEGSGESRRRLIEMGFIKGTSLKVIRATPLVLGLMNCRLALGVEQAQKVWVRDDG